MRVHGGEINAFLLGAALSWLATYLVLTHRRRTVGNIRKEIKDLALFHDLKKPQFNEALNGANVTDDRCWQAYEVALEAVRGTHWSSGQRYLNFRSKGVAPKLSPTILAAEIIICDRFFNLPPMHALRAMLRTKDYRDLKQNLDDVIAEIGRDYA